MINNKSRSIYSVLICLIMVGGLLIGMNASANDEVLGVQPVGEILLLAQGGSCMSKCEAAKKSCMARYTVTNNYGVKMVTPDGAKQCWAEFRQCKSYCR